MAILSKGQTFADGDQVTSTKLNALVDSATFVAGAVADATLSIDSGGGLKVGTIQTGNMAALSVTTAKLADSTGASDGVTTAKLATGAVTTPKIADAGVTTVKIADSNVTTAKVADANVTAAKLSGAQTGTAPVFGVRAWVVFDMTRNAADTGASVNGGTVKIFASGNVTSVTLTATGKVTVLMTTALPDTNYGYAITGSGTSGADEVLGIREYGATKTTTSFKIQLQDTSGNLKNFPEVSLMIMR